MHGPEFVCDVRKIILPAIPLHSLGLQDTAEGCKLYIGWDKGSGSSQVFGCVRLWMIHCWSCGYNTFWETKSSFHRQFCSVFKIAQQTENCVAGKKNPLPCNTRHQRNQMFSSMAHCYQACFMGQLHTYWICLLISITAISVSLFFCLTVYLRLSECHLAVSICAEIFHNICSVKICVCESVCERHVTVKFRRGTILIISNSFHLCLCPLTSD